MLHAWYALKWKKLILLYTDLFEGPFVGRIPKFSHGEEDSLFDLYIIDIVVR